VLTSSVANRIRKIQIQNQKIIDTGSLKYKDIIEFQKQYTFSSCPQVDINQASEIMDEIRSNTNGRSQRE
jgi:hypothetical protein